jgi:hypothetical protein
MRPDVIAAIRAGRADYQWTEIARCHGDHAGRFRIFRDALTVDGVRVTVRPTEAQQAADLLGAVLPTPLLLDALCALADVQIAPKLRSHGNDMDDWDVCVRHSARVDAAIGGRVGAVCPVGKHWVAHYLMTERKAVLYGWPVPPDEVRRGTWQGIRVYRSECGGGHVIQQPSAAHTHHHRDYSMTLVLVDDTCLVDGQPTSVADIARDPELCGLILANRRPLWSLRLPGAEKAPPLCERASRPSWGEEGPKTEPAPPPEFDGHDVAHVERDKPEGWNRG